MKKAASIAVAVTFALGALACSRDQEIGAVLDELDSFTKELVQAVESAPDPNAGVDRAHALLAEKGPAIKKKFESIKDARGFEVSEATKQRLTTSVTANVTAVVGLQMKYVAQTMRDEALRAKLQKLGSDYSALITGG